MIEFKGECGHTIRAKDEDAGKVVRCSYCGREAPVPDEREDKLDFLLNEVERTGEYESPRKKRRVEHKPAVDKGATVRARSDFNPFAVALKMCYVAIIITVVIVAGKFGYKQWINFDRKERVAEVVPKTTESQTPGDASRPQTSLESSAHGLLWPKLPVNQSGIYVNSVPLSATVYVRDAKENFDTSIVKSSNVRAKVPAGRQISLSPGQYEVAVAVKMTNPKLMELDGYREARRRLENPRTRKDEQVQVLNEYFLPDRASRVAVETLSDYSRVIVRYYDVEVVKHSWTPETALFLPRMLELSELVKCLPGKAVMGFDHEAVRMELDYCGVPQHDQQFVIDALSQVGMVPYCLDQKGIRRSSKKSTYWLFRISVIDGTISTTLLD